MRFEFRIGYVNGRNIYCLSPSSIAAFAVATMSFEFLHIFSYRKLTLYLETKFLTLLDVDTTYIS